MWDVTRSIELKAPNQGNYFLTVFGRPQADSACECERSAEANLAQSLHLLNSSEIQSKLSDGKGRAACRAICRIFEDYEIVEVGRFAE